MICAWLMLIGMAAPAAFAASEALTVRALDSSVSVVQNAALPIAVQADGKLLAFLTLNGDDGAAKFVLSRFNPDGSVDAGFNADALALRDAPILQEATAGGKIWVAGLLGDGSTANASDSVDLPPDPATLLRLNADGSVDASFTAAKLPSEQIVFLRAAGGGKWLVGGVSWLVDGSGHGSLVRLEDDGSRDVGFRADFPEGALLNDAQVQPDGKILVWLGEPSNGGIAVRIICLNADGGADTGFQPIAPAAGEIDSMALRSDGKLLVAVSRTAEDGSTSASIARYNADGSLDAGFTQNVRFDGEIEAIYPQPGDKTLLQGYFTTVNDAARQGVAQLRADGNFDAGFDPLAGVSGMMFASLAHRADGSFVIGYNLDGTGAMNGAVAQFSAAGGLLSARNLDGGQYVDRVTTRPGGVYVETYDGSTRIDASELMALDRTSLDDGFAPPPPTAVTAVNDRPFVSLRTARAEIYSGGVRKGKFLLTRAGGDLSKDLFVNYTIRGSAVAGQDYQMLKGTRIIKAGKSSARIRVKPVGARFGEINAGKATVKISLAPDAAYSVAPPASARVKILMDDPANSAR